MAPVLEPPSARRLEEESAVAAGRLGGGEQLVPTADKSATIPKAMVGTVKSSGVEAGVAGDVPESGAAQLVALEEQTAPPEVSQGVVGHALRPWSSPVVPPAVAEEDEVEEIEHEESRPQAVRILHKRDDEVVVVEEEDTTRELRRLESALAGLLKQIKVGTASGVLVFDIGDRSSSLSLCVCKG